jgi:NADP-dependent 3-hydroxy acid dehydrogenase YdfG
VNILELTPYVALAISLITLATLIKGNLTSGEKALGERMGKAETKMVDYDRRIQSVESEIKHLPDKDMVHNLQLDLTDMKGQMAMMVKSSEATERATRRVEEFLLSQTK